MTAKEKDQVSERKRWPPEGTREHLRAARAEMRAAFQSLMPPEYLEHRRAARREMLLAARSLIDRALERMEGVEKA